MALSPLAGKPAPKEMLIDPEQLEREYYVRKPDPRDLATLLEGYEPPPVPVHLIYPGQRHVPLKLRAFLDFSIPRLRARLGYKTS
jgi:DNA-binding transcriptional LysR family regulator